jgi:hypothetical protein
MQLISSRPRKLFPILSSDINEGSPNIPAAVSPRVPSVENNASVVLPFRMILGIFSMDTPKDLQRRKLIRRTYLSFYDSLNKANVTTPGRRICALADLREGNLSHPDECQLIYTFVIGANSNPHAPTELLDEGSDQTIPMTLDRSNEPTYERDVVYLNIHENMEEGKSTTWFKYASSKIPESLQIDLIAKVDTDTVVFPNELLAEVELQLQAHKNLHHPVGVYGGVGVGKGRDQMYFQGGFYFMSKDVARYITSQDCNRSNIIQTMLERYGHHAEDRDIGGFVETYSKNLVQCINTPLEVGWSHNKRFKDPNGFRVKWKEILAKEIVRLRFEELRAHHNNQECPPKEAILEAVDEFYSDNARRRTAFKKLLMSTGCADAADSFAETSS